MPFVDKPDRFSSDAIVPGRTSDPNGFVTEHTVIEGITGPVILYFSVSGIRQLAARYPQIALVPKSELDNMVARYGEVVSALDQVKAERDELREAHDRIAGLRRDGFTVQKKAGAPVKKG